MVKLHNFIKENNLKSRVVMTIHDAIVTYLHREEKDLIITKLKEFFEKDIPENNGIPQILEGNICDPEKGEVWGFGSVNI
jgi:DNA polymerase I-like protein with 3'-5' exonuclease and polymerase domains